jgi:chemotaxis protein histidine kinase CheA
MASGSSDPGWDLRALEELDNFEAVPSKSCSKVQLQALLAVPPADGEEGRFRLVLASKEHLSIAIQVDSVLPGLTTKGLVVEAQLQLGTQVTDYPMSTNYNILKTQSFS